MVSNTYLPEYPLTHLTHLPSGLIFIAVIFFNHFEPLLYESQILTPLQRQEFLESTYPAYVAAAAVPGGDDRKPLLKKDDGDDDAAAAAAGEQGGKAEEARLSTGNTAAKLALDQTVGAAVNTFLFSVFIHSIQAAMTTTTTTTTTASVGGGGGVNIDYGRVDWARVLARSRAEFAAMLVASWRLWPLVSLVNFTLVRTVEGRNLLGGLAGVGWGVYMSIFAAAAARS